MLHIINKSIFQHAPVMEFFDNVVAGDTVLLIEEGVYNGLLFSPLKRQLEQLSQSGVVMQALQVDVDARALSERLMPFISMASDGDFVDLVVNEPQVLSWR